MMYCIKGSGRLLSKESKDNYLLAKLVSEQNGGSRVRQLNPPLAKDSRPWTSGNA